MKVVLEAAITIVALMAAIMAMKAAAKTKMATAARTMMAIHVLSTISIICVFVVSPSDLCN